MGSRTVNAARRASSRSRALLAAALCAVLLVACGGGAGDGRATGGILVIAIDSLRADHLSCYGYDRETTPVVDSLAAEGVLFEEAFSAAPWRLPSHASLLTGCDPNVAKLIPNARRLRNIWLVPTRAPRLAVTLKAGREGDERSWATAAFMDHEQTSELFGFAPGFGHFVEAPSGGDEPRGLAGNGQLLREWLRGVPRDRSWFAYVHASDLVRVWQDPHPRLDRFFAPRPGMDLMPPVSADPKAFFAIPSDRWRGEALTLGEYEGRYDGGLRGLDEELGRLFDGLRSDGRWEDTTIVLVGTYGIQFGEAGLMLDNGMLSVADLRVPWIIRPRAGQDLPRGERIGAIASLMDLTPTLLELEGYEVDQHMHGVSQVTTLRGSDEPARRFAFASAGLQFGCVVFGERLAYEVTWPGLVSPSTADLGASWFGEFRKEDSSARRVVYDRSVEPFPPLGLRGRVDESNPEVRGLRVALGAHFSSVERVIERLRSRAWYPGPQADPLTERLKQLSTRGHERLDGDESAPGDAR
jgi:arylsulfatase